ncbi:uncharacterized protein LOC134264898 [Saccostrea cucullata]|uniref:uncharacterized protein LOC134264898 n=1 Tax=Saccostrea cuccullata TaxID=36930 RepID=UPI002ED52D6E
MVSGIVNCLWIVIIMTLSSSIDLQVAGTNPRISLFLIAFGFLFVLQFLCMLVHRFTTPSYFLARAPYKFGQNYRTSVAFLSRDLDPDDEDLAREARSLELQILERMEKNLSLGKRKRSTNHHGNHDSTSENASLLSNHVNDVYQGNQNTGTYDAV